MACSTSFLKFWNSVSAQKTRPTSQPRRRRRQPWAVRMSKMSSWKTAATTSVASSIAANYSTGCSTRRCFLNTPFRRTSRPSACSKKVRTLGDPKRRYSPQQSLNAALSQYAPGHEVWVDGKRYISLGLYAEREEDRLEAYQDRRLYFQCRVCNYADLLNLDQGYPEQTRDCPACGRRATLGPARRWVRPPGFSHPPSVTALPPDFDAGVPLRPTRATLELVAVLGRRAVRPRNLANRHRLGRLERQQDVGRN